MEVKLESSSLAVQSRMRGAALLYAKRAAEKVRGPFRQSLGLDTENEQDMPALQVEQLNVLTSNFVSDYMVTAKTAYLNGAEGYWEALHGLTTEKQEKEALTVPRFNPGQRVLRFSAVKRCKAIGRVIAIYHTGSIAQDLGAVEGQAYRLDPPEDYLQTHYVLLVETQQFPEGDQDEVILAAESQLAHWPLSKGLET